MSDDDDYNYILIDVDWRFPAPKARKRYVPVERAENAEAAIARVRAVCDRIWDDARYAHKYGFLEVVREVRYALEGDSDE
jgi:hypothetical protein